MDIQRSDMGDALCQLAFLCSKSERLRKADDRLTKLHNLPASASVYETALEARAAMDEFEAALYEAAGITFDAPSDKEGIDY